MGKDPRLQMSKNKAETHQRQFCTHIFYPHAPILPHLILIGDIKVMLCSFPTDQTSLGCLERSVQDTRHVSRPALDSPLLSVTGYQCTQQYCLLYPPPWCVWGQLHTVQVTKNSHAAVKSAEKRKFTVFIPKSLPPSLEVKIMFMFRRLRGKLGKLLSSQLHKRRGLQVYLVGIVTLPGITSRDLVHFMHTALIASSSERRGWPSQENPIQIEESRSPHQQTAQHYKSKPLGFF